MALKIRRGTNSQRQSVKFDIGELVWTTDTEQLYVGDNVTFGGKNILARSAGEGLVWNNTTQRLDNDIASLNLTTTDIAEGTPKYFTTQRAQDAIGALIEAGEQTNITVTYDDTAHSLSFSVATDVVGIGAVSDDTTPSLGGDLDLNSHDITGTGNIDITGSITAGLSSISNNAILTTNPAPDPPIPYLDSNAVFGFGSTTSPQTLWQYATTTFNVQTGIIGTVDGTVSTQTRMSRGTLASPAVVLAEDRLLKMVAMGYDGTGWTTAGAFGIQVDDESPIAEGFIPGRFGVITIGASGLQQMSFNSVGVLEVPTVRVSDGTASEPSIGFSTDGSLDTGIFHPGDGIIAISTDGTERVRIDNGGMRVDGFMKVKDFGSSAYPSPAEAGMIVLKDGLFQGYTGSGWVTLG